MPQFTIDLVLEAHTGILSELVHLFLTANYSHKSLQKEMIILEPLWCSFMLRVNQMNCILSLESEIRQTIVHLVYAQKKAARSSGESKANPTQKTEQSLDTKRIVCEGLRNK